MDGLALTHAKTVDLLQLIGGSSQLRRVANTNGGEYAGACPFCGGRDRFRAQPNAQPYPRWFCRNCGGEHWHSPIDYVMRRDGIQLTDAVRVLTEPQVGTPTFKPAPVATPQQKASAPPAQEWQDKAGAIVAECCEALWSDAGERARNWLTNTRGLSEQTISSWRLGYNASDRRVGDLFIPRGIVIPCFERGTLWYVKIRLAKGEKKYTHLKGGHAALYGAGTLFNATYAVVVEGEFDCMVTYQALQEADDPYFRRFVGMCTLGSATNPIDVGEWFDALARVDRFLVCYDADKEGERGAAKWSELTKRARRVHVPTLREGDKDLNDYHKAGGRILDLISFEIEKDRTDQEKQEQTRQ